jgi:hypothetical protein
MDKDVRVGAVFIKQWHGAGNTVLFALKGFLRRLLTGGVPRPSPPVDIYQLHSKLVANDWGKQSQVLLLVSEAAFRARTDDPRIKGTWFA